MWSLSWGDQAAVVVWLAGWLLAVMGFAVPVGGAGGRVGWAV